MKKWTSSQESNMDEQFWSNIWKSINLTYQINTLEKKSHMIISIEAEVFNKTQHTFLLKTVSKLEREGNLLSLIKAIHVNLLLLSYIRMKE